MSSRMVKSQSTLTRHGDVWQVRVPLPFPLRWVNGYLLPGEAGWTLIDPGLRTPDAEQVWEAALDELGLSFKQLERIVLTHHHPDHYGLAGWLQQRSDAKVFISRTGAELVSKLWGEGTPMNEQLLDVFRAHGLPSELEAPMLEHMVSFVPMVSPQPELSFIPLEEPFRLGDGWYKPILTPGHAAGHLCFYQEETKAMFCGDHVLPQISPNVSYLPGGIDENPLASYLASLAAVSTLEVSIAYPGHREPFHRFGDRARELLAHHEDRLAAMEAAVVQPATAYDICRASFGFELSYHQLRFALAETIAHMIWLQVEGRVTAQERAGVLLYER
ncbi:MBL fold metallo-hydrolase [Paenibacillus sp. YYML68]|uniref:MBL fold metallo-hydrolase n=1 Tax=Paenibacillus sp. YYML68 TaxID=2909250 RepID=UPI00248F9F0B|nr:MBL fold metallo-hydrolase [Paenibacillus sp. YYML68]